MGPDCVLLSGVLELVVFGTQCHVVHLGWVLYVLVGVSSLDLRELVESPFHLLLDLELAGEGEVHLTEFAWGIITAIWLISWSY